MKKLPPVRTLASNVLGHQHGKATLAASQTFLLERRSQLAKFRSVESFVIADQAEQIPQHKGCEYHLVQLRSQLARELWSRQVFIGVTVLDDLLFSAFVHGNSATPLVDVLEAIRNSELHHPGLVIYPVHSFGILGAGFLHWRGGVHIEYVSQKYQLSLAPQTNDLSETIKVIERVRTALGVKRAVPAGLIEHWHDTRAQWLTSNPLMIMKMQSYPGGYYENQFLITTRLRLATTLMFMLSSLQPSERQDSAVRLWSSARMNNFQTMDIHHYIVLFPIPGTNKSLTGDCVPMTVRPPLLAELSDLNVDLDPRFWMKKQAEADRIYEALSDVHSGYLKFAFGRERESLMGRVYRKLWEALVYFRRSFRRADDPSDAILNLAISFEMVLTDGYSPKVNERIVRRARSLLKGTKGMRKYSSEIDKLYKARGAIVHKGSTDHEVDLLVGQRAFAAIFLQLVSKLPSLSQSTSTPMKDLCGDSIA